MFGTELWELEGLPWLLRRWQLFLWRRKRHNNCKGLHGILASSKGHKNVGFTKCTFSTFYCFLHPFRSSWHVSWFAHPQLMCGIVPKCLEEKLTLHDRPSSTATDRTSEGFSITLVFWPEKSMATREFSEMLL